MKKLLSIIILVLFTYGCSDKYSKAQKEYKKNQKELRKFHNKNRY